MDRPKFTRQLFFLLLAVVLPSAALVIFGVAFLGQQRELAARRTIEADAAFARDIGRSLEDRLHEIAADAVERLRTGTDTLRYPAGSGTLWTGAFDGTRFRPAWSLQRKPAPISWGPFEPSLAEAARLEFRDRDFAAAAERYLRLGRLVRDERLEAIAGQSAARALQKAGDVQAATELARHLLADASTVVDENGVPIAYYAADLLLTNRSGTDRALAVDRLSAELDDPRWLTPERVYMLRDLLRATADSTHTADPVSDTEFVDRMRDDLPGLMRSGLADRWLRYGDRLVGTGSPGPDGVRHVFAVKPADLVGLAPDRDRVLALQFEGDHAADALSLRPYLRDAYVTLGPATGDDASIPRGFLLLGLFLLVGLTLFGGYLLWRDVRRESRLAQLRAQFVSSVSHELRTPLTSIRMFAETLMLDEATPVEDRRRYLAVISNESERLTRMLNNVLSASRIEQGTSTYHRVTADVREPVGASVSAMHFAFDQQGVLLAASIPDHPIVASIDPDAIEQAVLNLLSNALKYGAGSPVNLVLAASGSGEIDILVRDQGPGIASSERARIFDRFYRSESARNQRVAGAGLGLSLVKHIAEAHRGRVSLHSAIGEGSTFGIHIPTEP